MEMSVKSRILTQFDYTGPMSSSVWSLKLCFLVLIVCILTAPVRAEGLWQNVFPFNVGEISLEPGSQSANTSDMPEQADAPFAGARPLEQVAEPALDDGQSHLPGSTTADIPADVGATPSPPLIAKSPKTDLSRQLWQARINVVGDTKHSESKNELRRIIREISSVGFRPRRQDPVPLIVVEPIRKTEPDEIAPTKETPQENESGKIEHRLPYRPVSDETLQVLKNLSQEPEQLHNPLELAEILFGSHCLKEAAICYRQALNRMTAGETGQARDVAWLLFQIGNCLRGDDPATAIKTYGQLIDQHPDSPWASLAKAKSDLVDWYLKDAPDKLIDESKLPTL